MGWNQVLKIPHIGYVIIDDDVEIRANVTIDRGTIDYTKIGKGTKIDNLVQIGHNVEIGEHCLIVAMNGVAGSSKIGNYVTIAGQCGITGHLTIGDHSVLHARTLVTKDLPPHSKVSGVFAKPHLKYLKEEATLSKLAKYAKNIEKKLK